MTTKRSPSPSPTITLDPRPKPSELYRSSSEESIRVIHHAVLFPTSPHAGRVTYIRRTLESDAELIRRQTVAIATQPLTFAEDLAAKRKQLEIKAERRKREKAVAAVGKDGKTIGIPEINIVPASGKATPSPVSPTKVKDRISLRDRVSMKIPVPSPSPTNVRREQKRERPPPLPSPSNKTGNHIIAPISMGNAKTFKNTEVTITGKGGVVASAIVGAINVSPASPLPSAKTKPNEKK